MYDAGGPKCSCSKSKCLKLYCECFARGVHCGPECSCNCCCNLEEYTDLIEQSKFEILKRDPMAFRSKLIKNTKNHVLEANENARNPIVLPFRNNTWQKMNETPQANLDTGAQSVAMNYSETDQLFEELDPNLDIALQLKHRKGCTCKKSRCVKGYCECFSLGVPCTSACKCRGCKNCEHKDNEHEEF